MLAGRLRRGFVILIDYGHDARELYSGTHSAGTLTTFARHTMAGPESLADTPSWLTHPGDQDITAHVDFTSVRAAAEGSRADDAWLPRSDVFSARARRAGPLRAGRTFQGAPGAEDAADARRARQHAQGPDPRQGRRHARAPGMFVQDACHMNLRRRIGLAIMIVLRGRDAGADRTILVVEHADRLDRFHPVCRRHRLARRARPLVDPIEPARVHFCWRSCRSRSGSCSKGYNLFIRNWHYVGLPENLALRMFGYAWSFATIWPAMFEGAELVAV